MSLTRSPDSRTSPAATGTKPAMARSSEVLPLPLGPSSVTNSPAATSKLAPSTILVEP
jgi:hypothetical protein